MDSELIFKNAELNGLFQKKGFVVVELPNKSTLLETFNNIQAELANPLNTLKGFQNSNSNVAFHSTFLDNNKIYKQTVKNQLLPFFNIILCEYIVEYRIIQLNVFNKLPNTGFVSPHQNLTTVDEEFFTSLSIWVPLQDTNEENGGLFLKPRSGKKFEKYRNPYIYWPPLKCSTDIADYGMVPLSLKLGQAVIFDDSIVHASPDNFSNQPRLAFHGVAIPKTASPVYPKRNGDSIDLIEVNDEFWFQYSPGDPEPTLPIIKKVKYIERIYTKQDIG